MPHTGHDCHRQCLWPSPIQHRSQWHGVVLLTMNQQRFSVRLSGDRHHSEAAGGHADQHQRVNLALGVELGKGVRRDEGAERKPGQGQSAYIAEATSPLLNVVRKI